MYRELMTKGEGLKASIEVDPFKIFGLKDWRAALEAKSDEIQELLNHTN